MKFLARQPILDRRQEIYAYELLFRDGIQNSCEGLNLEIASRAVLDTSFLIGLEKITEGRRMFVNCPRDFLLQEQIFLFPPDRVVVELLETIKPDQEVVEACRRLRRQGYLIALDDFVETPDWTPLIELASFIKVDFRLTNSEEQNALSARHAGKGIRMLAEKVETPEEFAAGLRMGYSLFQGYFFCRPEMMHHHDLPSTKLAYLDLLRTATGPAFDIGMLAGRGERDPSITFRLLRYLNSAAFGFRAEIRSIPDALSLLGERELRKWFAVIAVGVLAEGKPDELMIVPLVRGRFCELIAAQAGLADQANDLFLLGLLSVMDAILDQPMEEILRELSVRQEIRDALVSHRGKYWDVLNVAIAVENADWEKINALEATLGVPEERLSPLYFSAVDWAGELRRGIHAPVPR